MKRYDWKLLSPKETPHLIVSEESEDGLFVFHDDHQRVRQRLLAKLCEARAEALHLERMYQRFDEREAIAGRTEAWLHRMAMNLRSSHPLAYFRRLGEDKPDGDDDRFFNARVAERKDK